VRRTLVFEFSILDFVFIFFPSTDPSEFYIHCSTESIIVNHKHGQVRFDEQDDQIPGPAFGRPAAGVLVGEKGKRFYTFSRLNQVGDVIRSSTDTITVHSSIGVWRICVRENRIVPRIVCTCLTMFFNF